MHFTSTLNYRTSHIFPLAAKLWAIVRCVIKYTGYKYTHRTRTKLIVWIGVHRYYTLWAHTRANKSYKLQSNGFVDKIDDEAEEEKNVAEREAGTRAINGLQYHANSATHNTQNRQIMTTVCSSIDSYYYIFTFEIQIFLDDFNLFRIL